MLKFTLFSTDAREASRYVTIDPAAVISVEEVESRDDYGYKKTAIIHLVSGVSHKVYDDRSQAPEYAHFAVASKIEAARKEGK